MSTKDIRALVSFTIILVIFIISILFESKGIVVKEVSHQDIYVEAVRLAESGGNQAAVSPVGAIGSMQVMPATANDPGFGIKPVMQNEDGTFNLHDIDRLGTDYLHAMLKRYEGSFEAALIAYNAGPGNADKWLLNGKDYKVLPDRVQTEAYVERAYTNYFHLLAG